MQNTNYPKRSGLVKRDRKGNFWVEGAELSALSPEIYMCICKLKDYEESGLSPSDVESLKHLYDDLVERFGKQKEVIEEMRAKLIELPVRPGDVIYDCRSFFYGSGDRGKIEKKTVTGVRVSVGYDSGKYEYHVSSREELMEPRYLREDFGTTVFLDPKKAEEFAAAKIDEIKKRLGQKE